MSDATVKERPIIFSGPMVRATLEGWKTQTRRVMKPQPVDISGMVKGCDGFCWESPKKINGFNPVEPCPSEYMARHCPYGAPGDRLWVREAWSYPAENCLCDGPCYCDKNVHYRATAKDPDKNGWRPSIHMPRWASRILLEITAIGAERLQDISKEDAMAEGATSKYLRGINSGTYWCMDWPAHQEEWYARAFPVPQFAFGNYMNRLHGGKNWFLKPSNIWDENPWVWVVKFRRVDNVQ